MSVICVDVLTGGTHVLQSLHNLFYSYPETDTAGSSPILVLIYHITFIHCIQKHCNTIVSSVRIQQDETFTVSCTTLVGLYLIGVQ